MTGDITFNIEGETKMKKRILGILLIVTALAGGVWAWGGRSGDKNATGQIGQLKVSNPMANVDGWTKKGPLWLGYTVEWNDGYELDYPVKKVKGQFRKTLYFQPRGPGVRKVTVCLWRYKVSRKQCKKENGKECIHCRKNGYHMEGQVDRVSGS